MREIIIIAGPNGAGKTSFAREYLPEERAGFAFVNADEIARTISDLRLSQAQIDMRAARAMLDQIDAFIAASADFVIETTLASLTYATKIPAWRGGLSHYPFLPPPAQRRSLNRAGKTQGGSRRARHSRRRDPPSFRQKPELS